MCVRPAADGTATGVARDTILVMTVNASTVLRAALALSADERAHIAADLIASLDDERDDPTAVTTPWAQELEHRARLALRDPGSGEDWDTARERIAGQLSSE
jgi:putative addiction module component (TIGR02574 family)